MVQKYEMDVSRRQSTYEQNIITVQRENEDLKNKYMLATRRIAEL